jgi:hypothetical protein
MSALVEGQMEFVSNGDPVGMMEQVRSMVTSLEVLGVSPAVAVVVTVGDSTGQRRLSVTSAGTGTCAPDAGRTWSEPAIMPQQDGTPSSAGDLDGGDRVLSAAGSGKGEVGSEGFLERGVDWGVTGLSAAASQAQLSLDAGATTWRKVARPVRLELIQAVLAQPTESGLPMMMGEYDQVRPGWMPGASGVTTTFRCAWRDLPSLRLDG